jgi:N-sulfoglucosamine sulfohydrolase
MLQATGLTPPATMTGSSFLPLLTDGKHTPRTHVFGERGPHVGLPEQSASFDQSRTIIGIRYKLIYNALWQIPYHPVDFHDTFAWTSIAAAQKAGNLSPAMARIYLQPTRPMFELYDLATDPAEMTNL